MTKIEADVTAVDGEAPADDEKKLTVELGPGVEPDPDPDPDNGKLTQDEFNAMLGPGLLALPEYPEEFKVGGPDGPAGKIDRRDLSFQISHGEPYQARLEEYPFQLIGAPPIITGETDETLITAFGARGESYSVDTKALEEAAKSTASGGVIKVPIGRFLIDQAEMPSHKNWTLRGTSMRGAELVSAPGHDILRITGWNAQRRLQNQHIYENISFYMNSKSQTHDHSKEFKRRTWSNLPVAHAAIAYIQAKHSNESSERKHNWTNSYPVLDKVFVHGDKNSNGPCAFYSDNCVYGLKVFSLFIGDHGSSVGGVPLGIILAKPPHGTTQEYSPDELFILEYVHWNPTCGISAANVANGYLGHIVIYGTPRTAVELMGVDSGARKRCRDLVIESIYSDNDAAGCKTNSPLIEINSDMCRIGCLHVKGSRLSSGATHRPVVKLTGERIKGDVTVMSSSHHKSPRFIVSGEHHDLTISAGGVHGDELNTLVNGEKSAKGVTIT